MSNKKESKSSIRGIMSNLTQKQRDILIYSNDPTRRNQEVIRQIDSINVKLCELKEFIEYFT